MMNALLPVMAHKTNNMTKEHEIIEFPLYEIVFIKNGDPGFIVRIGIRYATVLLFLWPTMRILEK